MKRVKKLISVLLTVALVLTVVPFGELGLSVAAASGTTGDCTWKIENGVLTISGNGEMGDDSPWYRSYRNKITTVVIENGVTSIGGMAFEDCYNLSKITVSDSVTRIGGMAFEDCSSLCSITIPNRVNVIGAYAFRGCNKLKSISIPFGVTDVYDYTFLECSSLTSVTLPNSIINIGTGIFKKCSSLSSIVIPASVMNIGLDVFYGCNSLEAIQVDTQNATYYAVGNCLINRENKTLIAGCKSSVIPLDGCITSVGSSAFSGCGSLKSITIPGCIISIGSSAFSDCSKLNSITLSNGIKSIGNFRLFRLCRFKKYYDTRECNKPGEGTF